MSAQYLYDPSRFHPIELRSPQFLPSNVILRVYYHGARRWP